MSAPEAASSPPPETTGWETERDTERAKVNARWFAIVFLYFALYYIRRHDPTAAENVVPRLIDLLAGAAIAMTAVEATYLWHPRVTTIPRGLKYVTVFGDMTFISVLLYYTGFARSPFFFVYFVFLISNCLRYGFLMSLFVAAVFNVEYVIVLGLAPAGMLKPSVLGGEGLKIAAFWATALYGGAVSARIRRQATQLRVYEETIAELKAQLAEKGEAPTHED